MRSVESGFVGQLGRARPVTPNDFGTPQSCSAERSYSSRCRSHTDPAIPELPWGGHCLRIHHHKPILRVCRPHTRTRSTRRAPSPATSTRTAVHMGWSLLDACRHPTFSHVLRTAKRPRARRVHRSDVISDRSNRRRGVFVRKEWRAQRPARKARLGISVDRHEAPDSGRSRDRNVIRRSSHRPLRPAPM